MKLSPIVGLALLGFLPASAFAWQAPAAASDPKAASNKSTDPTIGNVNASVLAARKASSEKRYADAEALMLKTTEANPKFIVPWIELGLAQLAQKKYPEAEASFKRGLGIDPASLESQKNDAFYKQTDDPFDPGANATHLSRNTAGGTVVNTQTQSPDIKGVGYASLGEIYLRTKRVKEGLEAFDIAAKANPADAALYRRNETIFCYQIGDADAQLAAAEKALAVDPNRAMLYFFKGQALAAKATIDDKTQKLVLPPGCVDAFLKYLQLDPSGQFAGPAKDILASAGVNPGSHTGAGKS